MLATLVAGSAMALVLVPGVAHADPATHLEVLTVADVRANDPFSVTVRALDGSGMVDTSFDGSVTLTANVPTGGSNMVGGAQMVGAVDGVATFSVLQFSNAANNYALTASSSGLTDGVSNAFNVTARRLGFIGTLPHRVAGASFNLAVRGLDGSSLVAENFNGMVTLTAVATGGSNFRDGSPSAPASAGTASLTSMELDDAANGYRIVATSPGLLDGTSNFFNVTATHIAVVPPDDPRAGDVFEVNVEARDATNAVAENFTGSVSIALNVPAGGSDFDVAPGPVDATAGVAQYAGLVLDDAADGYSVTATAGGFEPHTSETFDVTARQLVVTTPVPNMEADTPFALTVEAHDANGSLAENFAGVVSLSASAPAGSDFAVTPSSSAAGGTAGFGGLALSVPATGYTITASSPGPDDGTSNVFDVTPGGITRSLSLDLRRHLKAVGTLKAPDAPGCAKWEKIKIQRRKDGSWVTVKKTTTDGHGDYRVNVPHRLGRYRAVAPASKAGEKDCLEATSPVRTHRHRR